MNNRSLISYSFGTAWKLFKSNWKVMVGVALIMFLVGTGYGLVEVLLTEAGMAGVAVSLLSFLLSAWLSLGMFRVFLDIFDGKKPSIMVLFSQAGLILYFLGASILYGLMVVVGLVFLVVPGFFLAIRFYFYNVLIVDKELGPIKALKASWNLTKGHWWSIFGLTLLLALFNIAGALALIVGLLVTIPVSWMAMICAYRFLSSSSVRVKPEQVDRSQEPLPESFVETQSSIQ